MDDRVSDLQKRAAAYALAARSPETRRGYAADLADFTRWCVTRGLQPLPAEPATVGLYLADRAGRLATATLQRRLAAIRAAHREAGAPLDTADPALRAVWQGIRRVHGTQRRGKAPVMPADLKEMVAVAPLSRAGLRDRAVLLLGWSAALRRSELVGLDCRDLAFDAGGLTLVIRRSKSDPEGAGLVKRVARLPGSPYCPVAAVERWLVAARLADGPLFCRMRKGDRVVAGGRLSGEAVAQIVKAAVRRHARWLGLPAAVVAARTAAAGGHSLRAGFATAAAAAGAEEWEIVRVTGHRTRASLAPYIRAGHLQQEGRTTTLLA